MNHRIKNSVFGNRNLRFKQWSNKGYAAFCSVGKVVHIGNLAISLTQWIGNVVEHIQDVINLCMEFEHDDAQDETIEQELMQVVAVVVNTQKGCGCNVSSKNKNINCR